MTTHTDPRTTTYSEFAILIPCRTDDPDRIPRLYHDSSPRCSSLAAAPRHSDGCHLPPSPCGTRVHFTLPTHPITSPSPSVCIRQLQAVSVSRAAAMGLDLDLRTVALLWTWTWTWTWAWTWSCARLHCSSSAHTPHTTRQHHAAHGTPFTPHAVHTSRRPWHAGTPQFTRDWTRNPSGV